MRLFTDRLLVESVVIDDYENLYCIFSDPLVMRFWSSPCWRSSDEAREKVNNVVNAGIDGESVPAVIKLSGNNKVIGVCAFDSVNTSSRRAEIGFCLSSSCWGNGYMTEALTSFIAYGFNELNLNRIEADIDPRNEKSIMCVKRLGFQLEGVLRERWIVDGRVGDSAIYGLIFKDWQSKL